MDKRRLDTGDVLAAGILGKPNPDAGEPKDREQLAIDIEHVLGQGRRDELERGAVLHCAEYYGIPLVWKADDGSYQGRLLQYREVTESRTFESLDDALEWFADTAQQVAG